MHDSIIDTGPIKALFDDKDKYSIPIRNFFKDYKGKILTTLAIVTEVSYLLDENKYLQLGFIEWIKDFGVQIVDISNEDFKLIHKYMEKYKDTPMDFADASIVILSNKLNINRIISLDTDFDVYRTINGKKFENLTRSIIKNKT